MVKESERRLQSFKIQNEHLTGKLEEYHSMQKKLSDFRQEVQDLEDGRKKLEIELDQKKNIDGAIDYLKESNSKAANKIYHQEEQLKENKQVQLEQKQLLEIE